MPNSVCNEFTAPPDTTTLPPQTDPEPVPPPSEETVALIVGGSWNYASTARVMRSAELFGCPGYEDRSFPIDDFPLPGIYLASSIFYENADFDSKAMVCGGFQCRQSPPAISGPCLVLILKNKLRYLFMDTWVMGYKQNGIVSSHDLSKITFI